MGVCVSFVSKCFRVSKPLYHRVYPCCDWRIVLGARSVCEGVWSTSAASKNFLSPGKPQPQNSGQTNTESYAAFTCSSDGPIFLEPGSVRVRHF